MRKRVLVSVACSLAAAAATFGGAASAQIIPVSARSAVPAAPAQGDQVGTATWYGEDFDGRVTADGERFDMYGLTAAHANLPFNSVVEVTNLSNGRRIVLRITDRPEAAQGGVIVVSKAAAASLGFVGDHSAPVRVRLIRDAREVPMDLADASR